MDIEQQFQGIVDSVVDTASPAEELRRQLRQQVLAAVDAAGNTPALPQTAKRNPFMISNRVLRWTAAAAAMFLCVAAVWFLAGKSAQVAWADVQNGLAKVPQAVTMKVDVYQGQDLRKEELYSALDANRMRVESKDSVTIIDHSQNKVLVLVPQGMQAYASTVKDAKKAVQRDWLADLKAVVGSKDAKSIGAKTFDNQVCQGWQLSNAQGSTTVWADQKSAQLVRVEIEEGIVRTVISDFNFAPKLDEAQFSLKVPEGYMLAADTTPTVKDAGEDDLVLLLRVWSGGNDNVFPDSLTDFSDWGKAAGLYKWSQEKQDQATLKESITRAFFMLNGRQDWIYAGKGVKVGDAKSPIFWTPADKGKYHVLYGDLSARDVDAKDMSANPATQPAK